MTDGGDCNIPGTFFYKKAWGKNAFKAFFPHAFLKKRLGYCNRLRPSVTLSPPKPLDEIQPKLVCEISDEIFILLPGWCPRGRTWGYRGGLSGPKKIFPKFNQIWYVSNLHQWHMQRHNFFGPFPLGRGQKVKYH